jgi:mannose-1-phosphate guanylyltransferase
MPDTAWSIVLAGGKGERLAGLTGGVPKQFWSPAGGQTLLEATVARLRPLVPDSRTLVVIDQSHRQFADPIWQRAAIGHQVVQPVARGTACGALLGLAELAATPAAVVVLTPADHGVINERRFRRSVQQAVRLVRERDSGIVLFGVEPSSATQDYGWIVQGPRVIGSALPIEAVAGFVEKPDPGHALRLFSTGAAWNTMVLVTRVGTLLDLYRTRLPEVAEVFDRACAIPSREERHAFLTTQYPDLPHADFSGDVLAQAGELHVHIWPASMGWTDLGTPARLSAWLHPQNPRPNIFDTAAAPHAVAV